MPDPYTMVYDALWTCLETDEFKALVKDTNRIKYTDQGALRRPEKDMITEGDVPEVMLISGGCSYWDLRASGGASVTKTYSIVVTSGNRLLDTGQFFPIQWAITKAMYNYETVLGALTLDTEEFVKKMSLVPTEVGLSEDENNRDLKGWSAVWSSQVMMWFTNTILRGE